MEPWYGVVLVPSTDNSQPIKWTLKSLVGGVINVVDDPVPLMIQSWNLIKSLVKQLKSSVPSYNIVVSRVYIIISSPISTTRFKITLLVPLELIISMVVVPLE